MGISVGGPGSGLQSEINVTPLVDVVLVLLIIFMVIMPLTMRGYDMDIPTESVAAPREVRDEEQIVLGIDVANCPVVEPPEGAGCRVRVNEESMPLGQLPQRLREAYASRGKADRVLFLAAEERLNYEVVLRIVDVARSSVEGLRIGLVTGRGSSASRG